MNVSVDIERQTFHRRIKQELNTSLWWYAWISYGFYVDEEELENRLDLLTNEKGYYDSKYQQIVDDQ